MFSKCDIGNNCRNVECELRHTSGDDERGFSEEMVECIFRDGCGRKYCDFKHSNDAFQIVTRKKKMKKPYLLPATKYYVDDDSKTREQSRYHAGNDRLPSLFARAMVSNNVKDRHRKADTEKTKEGSNREMRPKKTATVCRYGNGCKRIDCFFSHVINDELVPHMRCRWNLECKRFVCQFKHDG